MTGIVQEVLVWWWWLALTFLRTKDLHIETGAWQSDVYSLCNINSKFSIKFLKYSRIFRNVETFQSCRAAGWSSALSTTRGSPTTTLDASCRSDVTNLGTFLLNGNYFISFLTSLFCETANIGSKKFWQDLDCIAC